MRVVLVEVIFAGQSREEGAINTWLGVMPALTAMLDEAARALLLVHGPDGLSRRVLDKAHEPRNDEETSALLLIAYALMKGARLAPPEPFTGDKALQACIGHYLDAQYPRGNSGVAGLGDTPYRDGSVAYYRSEPIVAKDPKGVAALFLSLSKSLRRTPPRD